MAQTDDNEEAQRDKAWYDECVGGRTILERLTHRSRLALNDAANEARRFGSPEALPEHLLLALLRDQEKLSGAAISKFVATRVLERQGVLTAALCAELLEILPPEANEGTVLVTVSPALQNVVRVACTESDQIGDRYFGTEHLLLALLRDRSVVSRLVARHGVTWQKAHAEVRWMREGD